MHLPRVSVTCQLVGHGPSFALDSNSYHQVHDPQEGMLDVYQILASDAISYLPTNRHKPQSGLPIGPGAQLPEEDDTIEGMDGFDGNRKCELVRIAEFWGAKPIFRPPWRLGLPCQQGCHILHLAREGCSDTLMRTRSNTLCKVIWLPQGEDSGREGTPRRDIPLKEEDKGGCRVKQPIMRSFGFSREFFLGNSGIAGLV